MKRFIMKCGHYANAEKDGKPYCVICSCDEIADYQPILTNRKAKCKYCGEIKDSNFNLPFFEFRPAQEYDSYYCGCRGWN